MAPPYLSIHLSHVRSAQFRNEMPSAVSDHMVQTGTASETHRQMHTISEPDQNHNRYWPIPGLHISMQSAGTYFHNALHLFQSQQTVYYHPGYVQKHNLSDPAPSDLSDGRSDRSCISSYLQSIPASPAISLYSQISSCGNYHGYNLQTASDPSPDYKYHNQSHSQCPAYQNAVQRADHPVLLHNTVSESPVHKYR